MQIISSVDAAMKRCMTVLVLLHSCTSEIALPVDRLSCASSDNLVLLTQVYPSCSSRHGVLSGLSESAVDPTIAIPPKRPCHLQRCSLAYTLPGPRCSLAYCAHWLHATALLPLPLPPQQLHLPADPRLLHLAPLHQPPHFHTDQPASSCPSKPTLTRFHRNHQPLLRLHHPVEPILQCRGDPILRREGKKEFAPFGEDDGERGIIGRIHPCRCFIGD
jgi:hypothetical protein